MSRDGSRGSALPLVVALWAAASPALALDLAGQGYRKLAGPAIREAFVGRTFTDGTHFSTRYHADGTIDGMNMGKKIASRWAIVDDELCVTNRFGEFCYAVWKKGSDVQLVYGDSDTTLYGYLQ